MTCSSGDLTIIDSFDTNSVLLSARGLTLNTKRSNLYWPRANVCSSFCASASSGWNTYNIISILKSPQGIRSSQIWWSKMWIWILQTKTYLKFSGLKVTWQALSIDQGLEQISRVFDTFSRFRCEIQCTNNGLDNYSRKSSAHAFEEASSAFLLRAFDRLCHETRNAVKESFTKAQKSTADTFEHVFGLVLLNVLESLYLILIISWQWGDTYDTFRR